MSNLTKAIIQVTDNSIFLSGILDNSVQELCGKQLEVILKNNSFVDAIDNPELRKYCLECREDITILFSDEFTILMEIPYDE